MAENKLEEIIDFLAEYGGFNREYLRDKLLTFANGGRSETKNKMEQVAQMFGKKMHERFTIVRGGKKFDAVFSWMGLELMGEYENPYVELDAFVLMDLLNGEAFIVNSEAEVEGAE